MTEARALITIVIRAMLESETPAVRDAGAECVKGLLKQGLLVHAEPNWNEPTNMWYNTFNGRQYLSWRDSETFGGGVSLDAVCRECAEKGVGVGAFCQTCGVDFINQTRRDENE